MICWRCHSNSVNTGSRLPICSDVKTRKRQNLVGIDTIRNNRIADAYHMFFCLFLFLFCICIWLCFSAKINNPPKKWTNNIQLIWDRHNLFGGRSPIILRGRHEKGMYYFFQVLSKVFFYCLVGDISLWLMAVPIILPTPLCRRESRRKRFFN